MAGKCPSEFGDLDGLVAAMSRNDLGRPAGRPVDLQERDPVGLGQADGLLERVGPATAARGDVPVDRQRVIAGRDDLDPGTDGRPVGLLADELDRQPVVPLPRVLEQDVVVPIAGDRAAHLDEDIDVAVTVPVGAGDAVPLLKVARCPDEAVMSANRWPATFLNIRLGTSVVRSGSPVPR